MTGTRALFLISWPATVVLLTPGALRPPLAFTVLFTLVDAALALVLFATLNGSSTLRTAGGYAVFAFFAVGVHLFPHVTSPATAGRGPPLGRPAVGG